MASPAGAGAALAPALAPSFWPSWAAAGRLGTGMAAAITRPGSAPRSMTSSSSTALITASRPSSEQATRRPLPVLTTAASWECTAARDGRSTNAVSALPVAYPVPEPSSSPARTLARRTVPSRSSRNIGTGALANMARSSRRSASVESAPWSPAGTASARSRAAASIAPSSSANAASSSCGSGAPGRAADCRSAPERARNAAISLSDPGAPLRSCI